MLSAGARYRRRPTSILAIRNTFRGLLLTAAVSLALTAPALGSPVGDQYLPQVPSASGDEPVPGTPGAGVDGDSGDEGDGDNGTGGGAGSSGAAGGGGGGEVSALPAEPGKANALPAEPGKKAAGPTLGGSAASAERDGDSGGLLETLLDPLVLVLFAGVLTIVLGTILARRRGDRLSQSPRGRRERGPSPPTPDGEIVAGGGKSRPG